MVTLVETGNKQVPRNRVYDPVAEAKFLCERSLVVNLPDGQETPRYGFEMSYQNFRDDWHRVDEALRSGDPRRATRIAWGIANSQVLANAELMAFFIRNAYVKYAELVSRADDQLVASEGYITLHERVAEMELDLTAVLDVSDEISREEIFDLVKTEDFASKLRAQFARDQEAGAEFQRSIMYARKHALSKCQSIYRLAHKLLSDLPAQQLEIPARLARPVKTQEDRDAERTQREQKKAARRLHDQEFRNLCKGPSGGASTSKGGKRR